MSNEADTVTPLDGGAETTEVKVSNVSVEDYKTQGQTTVATRRGYRFRPENTNIPVITADGVKVTAEQAESLIKESGNVVFKVEKKED